jgi:hypothetical protein
MAVSPTINAEAMPCGLKLNAVPSTETTYSKIPVP